MQALARRAYAALDAAEQADQLGQRARAIREVRECLMARAKLEGELSDAPQTAVQVNLLTSPDWLRTRAAIVAALRPYPDAAAAVAAALADLDGRPTVIEGPDGHRV